MAYIFEVNLKRPRCFPLLKSTCLWGRGTVLPRYIPDSSEVSGRFAVLGTARRAHPKMSSLAYLLIRCRRVAPECIRGGAGSTLCTWHRVVRSGPARDLR